MKATDSTDTEGKVDIDVFNQKILELWEKYRRVMVENPPSDENIWPRWPSLYDELKKEAVLYVGLNPSFVEKQMQKRLSEINNGLSLDNLKWEEYREDVEEFLKKERSYAKENYSYFTSMSDFPGTNGVNWEHIDLFTLRVTSQNKFKEVLGIEKKQTPDQKNFVEDQIEIFFKILEESRPRIIVIENAYARDLLKGGKYREENSLNLRDNYSLDPPEGLNESTGYQTIMLAGREVPIFFSGMLSGQRALDKGSRERLEWHVAKALKDSKD